MKTHRRWFLGFTVLLLFMVVGGAVALADDTRVRWDIVSIDFAEGTVSSGGEASALANDLRGITLTGSGTFSLDDHDEESDDVTGGGDWTTFGPRGHVTGEGTYRVTRLVSFNQAPGTFPGLMDLIGRPANARAGLAVLGIRYSDRSQGVLTVSCHLEGTPDSVFEGITVSKGFVDYWNRRAPEDGVDANRTVFHIVREREHD